jgi:hypothetical protein
VLIPTLCDRLRVSGRGFVIRVVSREGIPFRQSVSRRGSCGFLLGEAGGTVASAPDLSIDCVGRVASRRVSAVQLAGPFVAKLSDK